jgi:hypothetical protein
MRAPGPGTPCPYCRFPVKTVGARLTCGACASAHHPECWEENGGCAVTGCAGGAASNANARAPLPPLAHSAASRETAPPGSAAAPGARAIRARSRRRARPQDGARRQRRFGQDCAHGERRYAARAEASRPLNARDSGRVGDARVPGCCRWRRGDAPLRRAAARPLDAGSRRSSACYAIRRAIGQACAAGLGNTWSARPKRELPVARLHEVRPTHPRAGDRGDQNHVRRRVRGDSSAPDGAGRAGVAVPADARPGVHDLHTWWRTARVATALSRLRRLRRPSDRRDARGRHDRCSRRYKLRASARRGRGWALPPRRRRLDLPGHGRRNPYLLHARRPARRLAHPRIRVTRRQSWSAGALTNT